jgi:carbamoyl-phosphate synthase large subunit
VINTPFGWPGEPGPRRDGYEIRTAAVRRGLPCVTTMAGLAAVVQGIEAIMRNEVGVRSLQQHAAKLAGQTPAVRSADASPKTGLRGMGPAS